jgi:phosphate transport system permease protein
MTEESIATIGAGGSAIIPGSGGRPPASQSEISGASVRKGDRVFRLLSIAASASVLAIMAAIAAFLLSEAIPALTKDDANFLTETKWFPDPSEPGGTSIFGIASLAIDTVVSSTIAMVVAVPIAVGIALFIAYYAPRRVAKPLAYVVDLLAAVPSIVYGLWGFYFFKNHLDGLVLWLDRWFGWTGLFNYRPDNTPGNQSLFTAGLVLAIMILPIVSAISREVFVQVPRPNIEASLALGATRWEMIRMSVLPFGRAGVTSASILGLGRALGETLAVALILTQVYDINLHVTENGGITFASNIALKIGEAEKIGTGALIASGLVLFVITLGVNSLAQAVIRRSSREA